MTPEALEGLAALGKWLSEADRLVYFLVVGFALYRRVVYWGWQYEELQQRLDKAEARADKEAQEADKWREHALNAQAQLYQLTGRIAPMPVERPPA